MPQKLPKHILSSVRQNKTSLGDHPALPPDDERSYLENLLSWHYGSLTAHEDGKPDASKIQSELADALALCRKYESNNRQDLEQLVQTAITEVIEIPQDAIEITAELKDSVDASGERMFPEGTDGYTFEDLDDIKYLTKEIYKRRFLNALISGVATYYSEDMETYLSKLFAINPELPALYKKITKLNNQMLFLFDDTKMTEDSITASGLVSVGIGGGDAQVTIHAEGMTFPTLLYETFKGLFELAIVHGLPKDKQKAEYITKKADFRFAEIWDTRIGLPLWYKIDDCIKETGNSPAAVGVMYILMEIAQMEADDFNRFMQEVLAKTRKGIYMMEELVYKIEHSKEQDEFDDFMQARSSEMIALSDEEFFSPDELVTDSVE